MYIRQKLTKNLFPANQDFVVSDAGEIKRNWSKGIMTINTPKSQVAMGRIGSHIVELKDVTVTAENQEAAIIFTSLDKKPIRVSKRILISAVAKIKKKWKFSYISQPVKAEITFESIRNKLRIIALRPDGREGKIIQWSKKKAF